MTKPAAIRYFTLLYLGAMVVGVVSGLINLDSTAAMIDSQFADDPTIAASGIEGMGSSFVIGTMVIGVLFNLLMWFLIAVKRIGGLKWLLAVLLAYNVLTAIYAVTSGVGQVGVIGAVTLAMQAVAIYFLFTPEAKAWFAARKTAPVTDENTFD